jgi:hypothetical protein
MKRRDVDQALSAANPIDLGEALPALTAAEREFLGGVVAEPQEPAARGRTGRTGWRRRGFAARSMTLASIGAGALALLLVVNSGTGPTGAPASAYAAELARIAEKGSKVLIFEPTKGGSGGVIIHGPGERFTKPTRAGQKVRYKHWTVVHAVWDCTELPCVRRSIREARGAGIVPSNVNWRRYPPDAELVVPPSAGN